MRFGSIPVNHTISNGKESYGIAAMRVVVNYRRTEGLSPSFTEGYLKPLRELPEDSAFMTWVTNIRSDDMIYLVEQFWNGGFFFGKIMKRKPRLDSMNWPRKVGQRSPRLL